MGGGRDSEPVEGCEESVALTDSNALAGAVRAVLEDFRRAHPASIAELFLSTRSRLTLEYEVGTGTFAASRGLALSATVRVWEGEQYGFAAGPVGSAQDLPPLLESALRRAGTGARIPVPSAPVPGGPLSPGQPDLSVTHARQQAERIARTVVPPGVVVQALVLTRRAVHSLLLRSDGGQGAQTETGADVFLRCETSRGAVVDAVALSSGGAPPRETPHCAGVDAVPLPQGTAPPRETPHCAGADAVALPPEDARPQALSRAEADTAPLPSGEDTASLASLRERLAEAVMALEGPAEAADPTLPLVLRPAVAAPLVAGLSWLLRGDVASATPALARAVGRKPFPSLLTVEDDPLHPQGTRRRTLDDEGRPARAVRLIDQGRLTGFLHSGETAARLGAEPNGRGLREGISSPAPSPINLFIVPRADALPTHYTELVARVETFTTMPRPGTVSLIAAGWEVRDGQRVRRVAPMELDLPLLETFRALQGVGADLTFFPTADGCGTPTLVLPPPRGG